MSYKLVKVSSYYTNFLKEYYKKYPYIKEYDYNNQLKHLIEQRVAWSDFYSRNFKKLGVDAYEIVANAHHLQNQWAKENNSRKIGLNIVLDQLKKLKPNVVWFEDSFRFSGEFMREIRREVSSVRLIIGNCCAPYNREQLNNFKAFDFITTCSPEFVDRFEKFHIDAVLLYHAFEPTIHDEIDYSGENMYDFLFTGSIVGGKGFHSHRVEILEQLLDKNINLQFRGNIETLSLFELFKRQSAYITSHFLKDIGLKKIVKKITGLNKALNVTSFPRQVYVSKKLRKISYPPVYGIEMYKLLVQSKIGLNIHADIASKFAVNMRLFETSGVGTALLTDHKENITDLFEPGTEILTYSSPEECVEKANWLLENPIESKKIAKSGQNRCLRDHNYYERAKKVDGLIRSKLSSF